MISVSAFGLVEDPQLGRPVEVHEVSLEGERLRATILTYGAGINRVEVRDAAGTWRDACLHLRWFDPEGGRGANPYLGATVGRYANRIAGARFPLDGRVVELVANEGPNQLHGGPGGFHQRNWDLVEVGAPASVSLSLRSSDGDQGFPGTLVARATYVVDGPALTVTYEATSTAPTVVNLCNHVYWNLDPGGSVDEHRLEVPATRHLPLGPDGIPIGAPEPVDRTTFDLRSGRRIGDVVAERGRPLDDAYLLDDVALGPDGLRFAARLDGPRPGLSLTVRTDQVGLQVYDGSGLRPPFPVRGGVCLETQALPDTPNRPELGSSVLRPGSTATATTRFELDAHGS